MEVLWVGQISEGPNVPGADVRGIVRTPYATADRAGLPLARAGLKSYSAPEWDPGEKPRWEVLGETDGSGKTDC